MNRKGFYDELSLSIIKPREAVQSIAGYSEGLGLVIASEVGADL